MLTQHSHVINLTKTGKSQPHPLSGVVQIRCHTSVDESSSCKKSCYLFAPPSASYSIESSERPNGWCMRALAETCVISTVNLLGDFEDLREVVRGRLLQCRHTTYCASSSTAYPHDPKYLAARVQFVLVSCDLSTLQVVNETSSASRLLVRNAGTSSRCRFRKKTCIRRRKLIGADEALELAWGTDCGEYLVDLGTADGTARLGVQDVLRVSTGTRRKRVATSHWQSYDGRCGTEYLFEIGTACASVCNTGTSTEAGQRHLTS
jgi:hypothetical protein